MMEIKTTTKIYTHLSSGIFNKYTPSNMNCEEHKRELNLYRNKRWVSVESILKFFEVSMDEDTGEVDWNMCQELKEELEEKEL